MVKKSAMPPKGMMPKAHEHMAPAQHRKAMADMAKKEKGKK